jgi:hypothetical protein
MGEKGWQVDGLRRFWIITIMIAALSIVVTGFISASRIKEITIDEVQTDGFLYSLVSKEGNTEYGDWLMIRREGQDGQWLSLYENDFKDLKPWKIEVSDIDGDRRKEILIAVNKTTHFDDHSLNRMFIFNYEDNKLVKKWTGSQIAGAWKTFYVGDLLPIPGDELMFIEELNEGGEEIELYYWLDFGFVRLAKSDTYDRINDLSIEGPNRLQATVESKQSNGLRTFTVKDGKIIEIIS